MRIRTDSYELIDVRRIRVGGQSAQIAVRRIAYSPDRLYAWQGHHAAPRREWEQGSHDTIDDLRARVRHDLTSGY